MDDEMEQTFVKVDIIKKQNTICERDLEKESREELIARIKSLEAHNIQLKSIISKSEIQKQSSNKKSFDFSKCNFRHILLKLFYLGWDHQGFATQEDTINTIEYHLFSALRKTCIIKDRSSSNYHRCGRTDKGVSAFEQTISLNVRSRLSKENQDKILEEISYCQVLNRVLPNNIQCVAWAPVEDNFSARFECKSRTYKYFFPKGNLDLERMKVASQYLLGTHDFRNLCKMDVGNGVVQFIRNIKSIDISLCFDENEDNEYSMSVITIKGQAFLWHQIRCIMGVLFLIGQKKEEPGVILELLDVKKNSRKPEYNMANEVPLILYSCDYGSELPWHFSHETLNAVVKKLKEIWMFQSIKTTMIKTMLSDLNIKLEECNENSDKNVEKHCLTNPLIDGVKSKKYIPLMKRQKCGSLEDKIQHFAKRKRIEIKEPMKDMEEK